MVQDGVLVRARNGECFAQLPADPFGGGVRCHVEVQNLAPVMVDHEEAVQHAEAGRRDREEIRGGDRLAVVPKKGRPLLPAAR